MKIDRELFRELPYMVFADDKGNIYDHPYYRMLGMSGSHVAVLKKKELLSLPEFSKLFFIPHCPPVGLDPKTGEAVTVREMEIGDSTSPCNAVAAFLEPGFVRSYLPAVDYADKSLVLPSWAYGAVGFKRGRYVAAGFRVEYNHRWDPRNYDDRKLVPAIKRYKKGGGKGPLVDHLFHCATINHCFAAKNLFLERWEAPVPVSRSCNASCLGCLSLQTGLSCESSHERISFTPSQKEIVDLAVRHLERAEDAIISFGQGCEGEPLTEYQLIASSIEEIRRNTDRGTINLNTNGSWPDRIRTIAESGLDSIRISINSAQEKIYTAYYRPKGYCFEDVIASISLAREMGLYVMINYLVFPGMTDTPEEMDALRKVIRQTGVNFIHLKNLCIDPQVYLQAMPKSDSYGIGMVDMTNRLKKEFPNLELGYFNQPVHLKRRPA
jgi:pyruvate-formate lyase-activating enzyme